VQELEAEALLVLKVRGRGYKLTAPIELLDLELIRGAIKRAAAPVALELLDQCASTNTLLLQRAAAGAPTGTAIACELQSAGRGRRGNRWIAPLGGGLAFSLLWRFDRGASALAGLSLAAGVACMRALIRCGARDARLKWPNDIVQNSRKLGGILVELSGEYQGPSTVVCGIGLNTRLDAATRGRIDQPVTDLTTVMAVPPSRSTLLAALLVELAGVLAEFAQHGFAVFRDEWLRHHAHQGERVRLALGEARTIEGRALGVAEDGALLLEHAGTVERFYTGDITLRQAA
jgi:BirA family biotin operon repressor/biotin-[acetyl-CoA-carboxylase] ligase